MLAIPLRDNQLQSCNYELGLGLVFFFLFFCLQSKKVKAFYSGSPLTLDPMIFEITRTCF